MAGSSRSSFLTISGFVCGASFLVMESKQRPDHRAGAANLNSKCPQRPGIFLTTATLRLAFAFSYQVSEGDRFCYRIDSVAG
jgi:hypothetical protein